MRSMVTLAWLGCTVAAHKSKRDLSMAIVGVCQDMPDYMSIVFIVAPTNHQRYLEITKPLEATATEG